MYNQLEVCIIYIYTYYNIYTYNNIYILYIHMFLIIIYIYIYVQKYQMFKSSTTNQNSASFGISSMSSLMHGGTAGCCPHGRQVLHRGGSDQ